MWESNASHKRSSRGGEGGTCEPLDAGPPQSNKEEDEEGPRAGEQSESPGEMGDVSSGEASGDRLRSSCVESPCNILFITCH